MIIKCGTVDISDRLLSYKRTIQFPDLKLIGNAPSAMVKLTLINDDGALNSILDNPFTIIESTVVSGTFYVKEKPEKYTKKLELELYDNMSKLDMPYKSTIDYTAGTTIRAQLAEMNVLTGVPIVFTDLPSVILNRAVGWIDTSVSIRNYIGWIAELCGMNAVCDGSGNVRFRSLSTVADYETDELSNYSTDETWTLSKIIYDDGLNVVEYPEGSATGNTLYIDNNNMYVYEQSHVQFIYERLAGLSFTIAKDIKMPEIAGLYPGQMINYNNSFSFIALSIESSYTGGSYCDYSISGEVPIKSVEGTIVKYSDSVRIKNIKTIIDRNEQKMNIIAENVSDNAGDISDLQVSVGEVKSTVSNWSVGGYNMLLDTNAESLTKKNALADRYFSDSGSSSYIKTSIVNINDSPFDGDIYGAEYEVIGTPSSYISRCLCWYNNANAYVELIPGQKYTMSCYARVVTPGTTSDGLRLKFLYGVSPYYAVNVDISGTTWQRYSHTFEAKANYLDSSNKTRIYLAGLAIASGETAGKVQTCGFKLERGTLATDWSESPYEFEKNTNTIIDQRKDEIVLAAHSYTKVGGTNLLRNTAAGWGDWITPPANTNNKGYLNFFCYDLSKFIDGTEFTVSYDIEFSGASAGTGGTARIGFQNVFQPDSGSAAGNDYNNLHFNNVHSSLPIADGIYHEELTATLNTTKDRTSGYKHFQTYFRTDYWNGTGKFRIRNLKLEVGNVATAWSPSPADTEDRFSDVESKITAAKFDIQDDSISASVSQFIGEYLDDNKYATTDDINEATSGLVSTTKLTQTASAITGTVSQIDKRVGKLENNDETYQTWFTFDSNALTIGKTGSPVKANLTNTALNFTDGTNILASVSSANGLVGKEVQVGDTNTDNLRWRLTTNSAGDHFRITRHQ